MQWNRSRALVVVAVAALSAPVLLAFSDDGKPVGQPASQPGTPPAGQQPGGPGPGPGQRGPRDRGPREGGREGAPGDQVLPPSIRQAMKLMGRSAKALQGTAGDPARKDEALKQIGDFQRGCLAAKNASVDQFMDKVKDPAAKKKAAEVYRPQLILMMQKSLALETAVIEGKTEEAKKLLSEMTTLKDDSHKMIGAEED